MNWTRILATILSKVDVTEILKDKRLRWSAKRTIGAVIALTACNDIATKGMSWPGVVMCFVAVLPLCLSLLELDDKLTLVEKVRTRLQERKQKKDV